MKCDIGYRATIHFDFVVRDDKDELLTTLRSFYDDVHHTVMRAVSPSGVDGDSSMLFTNPYLNDEVSFPVEHSDFFESIRSYVTDLGNSIIGVVTWGMISETEREKAQKLDKNDARDRVQKHLLNIKEFRNSIPSITNVDFPCNITYLELKEPQLGPEEAKSIETLHNLWEECGSELNRYHVYFADSVSILDIGENIYLLTPQALAHPLSSMTLVNLTSSSNERGVDSDGLPYWHDIIQKVYPYLKLGEWLGFRRKQLGNIESDLHDILGSTDGTSGGDTDELLSIQDKLADIRSEWIGANIQLVDELEEMKSEHRDILTGETNLEFESSPPAPEDTLGSTNALLPIWESNLQNWLEDVESLKTRVSQKHEGTTSHLHGVVMAQSAISSLKLQDRITTLTRALLVLTAVLLLVEVVDIPALLQWVIGVYADFFRLIIDVFSESLVHVEPEVL